jgi:hypothetical protein
MWPVIGTINAETSRYTLVITAIAVVAGVWLPTERRRLIGRIRPCPEAWFEITAGLAKVSSHAGKSIKGCSCSFAWA